MTKAIPAGYHAITPHLIVADGAQAIDFYKKAFGATEITRMHMPGSTAVMHAQLKIGDSIFMLGGEMAPHSLSPKSRGGTTVSMHIYCENADAAFDHAVKAGCSVIMPVMDQFWGDRYGVVVDPFGHRWAFATHQHDYTPEQVAENAKAFFARFNPCPDKA